MSSVGVTLENEEEPYFCGGLVYANIKKIVVDEFTHL
jgi:hypothetical protein